MNHCKFSAPVFNLIQRTFIDLMYSKNFNLMHDDLTTKSCELLFEITNVHIKVNYKYDCEIQNEKISFEYNLHVILFSKFIDEDFA